MLLSALLRPKPVRLKSCREGESSCDWDLGAGEDRSCDGLYWWLYMLRSPIEAAIAVEMLGWRRRERDKTAASIAASCCVCRSARQKAIGPG